MIYRILILLSLFWLIAFNGFSQTYSQYVKKGDEHYAVNDFHAAALYYKKALNISDSQSELCWKYAESCRQFNDYQNARTYYGATLKKDRYQSFPLAEYWLGSINKYLGDYEQARVHFERFRDKYRSRDFYYQSAIQQIQAASYISDHIQEFDSLIVIEKLGKEVNTPYTDFSGSEIGDTLFQFSSMSDKEKVEDKKTYFSRIYSYTIKDGKWKRNKEAMKSLENLEGHIANGSPSFDGKYYYFTICSDEEGGYDLDCEIYRSSFNNGQLSAPKPLPKSINAAGYTSTHPYHGNINGKEYLIFTSDRPGGKGMLDLWWSEIVDGNFQAPENLGDLINTEGNELTPFTHNQILYFSSDWHYGYGGYDIFKSEWNEDKWLDAENLGRPINTSYNDLYFNLNEAADHGYLSSNRIGSEFITQATCCNDLYTFDWTDVPVLITSIDSLIPDSSTSTAFPPSVLISDSLDKLLPVTLYFHNDEPICCTEADSTTLTYTASYNDYISLEEEYVEANESGAPQKAIEDFFDNKVEYGFEQLTLFNEILILAMEAGLTVELTVEGYCSPLAKTDYNVHLANRRIAALKNNYFTDPFFKEFVSNQNIQFKRAPFGESTAPEGINDDPNNVQLSVYHPQAAQERRVKIIAVHVE